jgi:hypothetical protein
MADHNLVLTLSEDRHTNWLSAVYRPQNVKDTNWSACFALDRVTVISLDAAFSHSSCARNAGQGRVPEAAPILHRAHSFCVCVAKEDQRKIEKAGKCFPGIH